MTFFSFSINYTKKENKNRNETMKEKNLGARTKQNVRRKAHVGGWERLKKQSSSWGAFHMCFKIILKFFR